jgi:hypothetical protein
MLESSAGGKLKQMLVNEFYATVDKLLETEDKRYIADLRALKSLIDKLNLNQFKQEEEQIKKFLLDRMK